VARRGDPTPLKTKFTKKGRTCAACSESREEFERPSIEILFEIVASDTICTASFVERTTGQSAVETNSV
jgi:hypothetical protein